MSRRKHRRGREEQVRPGEPQTAGGPIRSGLDRPAWIPNLVIGLAILLIGAVLGLLKEWRILIALGASGLTLLSWVAVSLWWHQRKFLMFASLSAIIWLCAVYWITHAPFVESEVHGLLLPANEEAPGNNCPGVPSNAVLLLLGKMPVYATSFPHRVISVDKDEVLLSIDKKGKGIAVSARLFSDDGKIVAEIDRNEFFLNPSNYFRRDRPDKSSLIVYDLRGERVLDVRYLNERAVRILAHFRHPSGAGVEITSGGAFATEPFMTPRLPDAKIGQFYLESACMIDRRVDIPLHTLKEERAVLEELDQIEHMRDPIRKRKAKHEWHKKFQELLKKQTETEAW